MTSKERVLEREKQRGRSDAFDVDTMVKQSIVELSYVSKSGLFTN